MRGHVLASSDVLRPNARTRTAFDGRVVGRYERVGPNAWDGFRLQAEEGRALRVFPGLKVQLEAEGTVIRMRAMGTVVRVAWVPGEALEGASPPGLRAMFVDRCLVGFAEKKGVGATALIARNLGL